ncbi:hypothetical protein GCM10018782_30780 [Streptomyces griseoaurantiacus]|nr:hypothetical protein GCM10018782_30780 [Streptomyces griseoaurantiacus]
MVAVTSGAPAAGGTCGMPTGPPGGSVTWPVVSGRTCPGGAECAGGGAECAGGGAEGDIL